ncbi:hypothetical protein O9992_26055 [Vibrio lentus]|nr:hypothetical protein [Vibrio lentus]
MIQPFSLSNLLPLGRDFRLPNLVFRYSRLVEKSLQDAVANDSNIHSPPLINVGNAIYVYFACGSLPTSTRFYG